MIPAMLNQLTISELTARLRRREASAREATQACLDQIARVDGQIHAFISHDAADAHFVVVTVPRAVSLEAVAACLAENEARWEHADPTYAELHPDEA
jgi:Asp-tRNA(Asn)/Glu-tRNA(Gln) amidotransferase A subunit family amidase